MGSPGALSKEDLQLMGQIQEFIHHKEQSRKQSRQWRYPPNVEVER